MAGSIYFGNAEKFTAIPAPRSGADGSHVGASSTIQLANGGAIVEDSTAQHREFSWDWIGDATALRIIKEFAQGVYGRGLLYWVDPFAMTTNLLPPNWAAPRLAESDWKAIYDLAPTSFAVTPANTYSHPAKSAVYDLGAAAALAVPARRLTIPLAPGMGLYFGASGTVTGTAAIALRPIMSNGAYGTILQKTPGVTTASVRYQSQGELLYSAGVRFVEVFLNKTTAVASTITLASMVAKLVPEGSTPILETDFVSGEGSTGLRLSGGIKETLYTAAGNTRVKGFSIKLVETEAWEL